MVYFIFILATGKGDGCLWGQVASLQFWKQFHVGGHQRIERLIFVFVASEQHQERLAATTAGRQLAFVEERRVDVYRWRFRKHDHRLLLRHSVSVSLQSYYAIWICLIHYYHLYQQFWIDERYEGHHWQHFCRLENFSALFKVAAPPGRHHRQHDDQWQPLPSSRHRQEEEVQNVHLLHHRRLLHHFGYCWRHLRRHRHVRRM